jgi:branched-chain amino acid transport system substrate-binding protein
MRSKKRLGSALFACCLAALLVTAWVTGASGSRAAASIVGQGKASPKRSVCGLGTGKKATGKPVNIGAIVTVVPGLNWDEITDNAAAYYNCVNDNGGLNGRPINFIVHVEQINPEQVAAFAKKLIEEEKVVALAGTIDVLDCAVNGAYYKSKGFYVIGDGVHDSCYGGTPYHAAINFGPAYSTLGAAQYLVRKGVKGTVVVVSPLGVDAAGTWNKPAIAFLKSKGIKGIDIHDPYPFQGPQQAQKYVQLAGKGGGVILDSTTSETLKVIKAAEAAGIANDVLWAGSTPSNDTTFAKGAGKFWNGKFGVNAELTLLQGRGPDATLYRAVHDKYVDKWGKSSFGQFGFLDARIAVEALLTIPPNKITAKTANAAFLKIKNFRSDLLCGPWYYGTLPGHVPSHAGMTVVPKDGKMVQAEACFNLAPVTAALKAAYAAEKKFGLTSGTPFPAPAWQRKKPR